MVRNKVRIFALRLVLKSAMLKLLAGTLIFAILAVAAAQAADIVDSAHVHDGDTLTLGNTKVRLEGIDAPETDQICLTSSGEPWRCGLQARDKPRAKIGMAPVT
jgi:endonuclease YncB( thermonuclease family)